ncbi:MAG: response regulator [Deltaproteobacteria bacterium]
MGHLLLVDDSPVIRALLRRALRESPGLTFDLAESGEAGLAAALARRPDALVTDLQMPGLGGVGLIRAFRAQPTLAATPIAVLTGGGDDDAEAEARAAGASRILAKPFEDEALRSLVRALLAG